MPVGIRYLNGLGEICNSREEEVLEEEGAEEVDAEVTEEILNGVAAAGAEVPEKAAEAEVDAAGQYPTLQQS